MCQGITQRDVMCWSFGRMDATVFPEGRGVWHVNTTRTMRSLGEIVQREDQTFWILPDEGSDLQGISGGPHASAEDAMAAIGAHLHGTCIFAGRKRWRR